MTVLKGKGTLKIFMSDFSLFDILHHYEIVVHDYKEKVKKELIATYYRLNKRSCLLFTRRSLRQQIPFLNTKFYVLQHLQMDLLLV